MNNLRFTENLKSAVTGNTVERYSFDAWGRRRNPQTLSYDNFNRLTAINTNGTTYRMAYDRYGRMESKSQHDFSFDNARFSVNFPFLGQL